MRGILMVTKFWLAEAAPVTDSREHDRELNVTNRPTAVVMNVTNRPTAVAMYVTNRQPAVTNRPTTEPAAVMNGT